MDKNDIKADETVLHIHTELNGVVSRIHVKPVFSSKGVLQEGISIELTAKHGNITEALEHIKKELPNILALAKTEMEMLSRMSPQTSES